MATRFEAAHGPLQVRAYVSGYVVWLAWDYTGERSDLLGFAVSRAVGDGKHEYLRGMRRFKTAKDAAGADEAGKEAAADAEASANQALNTAPVQAFSWADYAARPASAYRYRVEALHGAPGALVARHAVELAVRTLAPGAARHEVFFNRGAAGSQAYARQFGNKAPSEVPGHAAYRWLSRGLEEALEAFVAQATDRRWALRVAAYELDYVPFLAWLRAAHERGVDVRVVHDCKKGKDHVPRADAAIEKAGLPPALLIRRTAETSAISHNKFIVAVRDGVPCALWTGSCNFTEGGLFGQANAGHWLHDDVPVAQAYLAYWARLAADPALKELRPANDAATPLPAVLAPRSTTVLFSPRSSGDALRMYTDLFRRARHSLCFTAAFGINKEFADVLVEPNEARVLRYVCLEKRGKGQADIERLAFNRVAVGAVLEADEHTPWQEEKLSGLNQHVEYIHTKVLLIDPFSADPTVVVGSGNFSSASVEKNDENMLVVRGDTQLSDQYLVEFMRLFAHFAFRNQVAAAKRAGDASAPLWLAPDASWAAPYFAPDAPAAYERRLFVGALDAAHADAQHKDLVISLAPPTQSAPQAKEAKEAKETGSVDVASDGGFVVTFAYNKDAVEALKTALSAPHRRWDGDGKRWLVAAAGGPALAQLARTYRWTLSPSAAAALTGTAPATPAPTPAATPAPTPAATP